MTTPSEDQYIKLSSLRDRTATSAQIQNLLNRERKTPISKSTVRRRQCCSSLTGREEVSKPTRPKAWSGLRNSNISQWMTGGKKIFTDF